VIGGVIIAVINNGTPLLGQPSDARQSLGGPR
jgi:hypothetical protein